MNCASGYNGAAGNYVVIASRATTLDYVYMHMRGAPARAHRLIG